MATMLRPANVTRRRTRTARLIFLFLPLLILTFAWPAQGAVPGWSGTGSLATVRGSHTATLLPNGQVLVAGGYTNIIPTWDTNSAELYDQATNSWHSAQAMAGARYSHTATLLGNGKVLVTGGYEMSAGYLNSAELYDPEMDSWSSAGNMFEARYQHTATLLTTGPNAGKVLVVGGSNGTSGYLKTAEIYDPDGNSWSHAAPMTDSRRGHTATLLGSGQVLVAGGTNGSYLNSAELYDPAGNSWSPAGAFITGRCYHTATLLGNGQVLVAGGFNGSSLNSSVLYDPTGNSWGPAASLAGDRAYHTATLLPNGKVLAAGGEWASGIYGGYLNSSELYDPAKNAWISAGVMTSERTRHTATLLLNGRVLAAGGRGGSGYLDTAELYRFSSVPLGSLTLLLLE